MERRLLLTVTYKNGNSLKQLVNYVERTYDALIFTVDKQVQDTGLHPVKIPLENINEYEIKTVMCEGWKVIT